VGRPAGLAAGVKGCLALASATLNAVSEGIFQTGGNGRQAERPLLATCRQAKNPRYCVVPTAASLHFSTRHYAVAGYIEFSMGFGHPSAFDEPYRAQ